MSPRRSPFLVLTAIGVLLALAPSAPAASCRPVTVDRGGDAGEESAYRIRARHIRCKPARRVLREYLRTGDPPSGWKLRKNSRSFKLVDDGRTISFRVAS